ncbi:aminopeptidase [soil metagenome]
MRRVLIKRTLLSLLCILFLLAVWKHELISYGIGQANGQLKIIFGARPISEVLHDPEVADTIKQKLILIQEIRQFAFDSLGINESENYTTFYDQKGKPLLWVVTGSEPYALKAKKWKFPLLGSFSYKGYFDLEKAKNEELLLKAQKYDTHIGTVSGWSTLGWLKDPVLSGMLKRNEGELTNLIIHELTHGTLFVKDSVEFNENLASFIGDKGAEKFLAYKFGKDSEEYKKYIKKFEDHKRFTDHVLNGAVLLDTLYSSFKENDPEEVKFNKKHELILNITSGIDTIAFNNPGYYQNYFNRRNPNNTFFMSYLRYSSKLDNFEYEYRVKYKSDLKKYLEHLKSVYPSL